MKQILAWHFVGDTLRDGSAIPADGEWIKVSTPLSLCNHGLHAILNPFDALQYAPGSTLCRVALRGEIVHGTDKLCASERMIICRMDAKELLRYFARMQAIKCLEQWDTEPPDVVLDYLMTANEDLSAAESAAAWDASKKEFTDFVHECFGV